MQKDLQRSSTNVEILRLRIEITQWSYDSTFQQSQLGLINLIGYTPMVKKDDTIALKMNKADRDGDKILTSSVDEVLS